jgi:tetratricopeptide (TPR) repeat protein
MRVIYLPQDPMVWVIVGGVLLFAVAYAIFRSIRPPLAERLAADPRYRHAMEVYVAGLPQDREPTRGERRDAALEAIGCLVSEHGVGSEEAGRNLRVLVAAHDKALSYDLRHEALACEEAGEYGKALEYFERAARLQEEHDPKDHQFLLRCVARVRGRLR